MSAFRAALLLGCGACALANRAAPTLDDGLSLMQITSRFSRELLQEHKAEEPIKLEASDGSTHKHFGTCVSISADGARVAVGAFTDSDAKGSAYLFDAATGSELRKLTLPDGQMQDWFGFSVSMSANGSRVAVGATRASGTGPGTGSAFVFDVETGSLVAKLAALDGASGDYFGYSVSISADGTRLAAGAKAGAGAAYVFNVATGEQLLKLTAQDGAPNANFGVSVSISADAARVAVGAEGDDAGAGSVHVFDVVTGRLLNELTAPDRAGGDHLGTSVSMSFNGSRVAAGAKGDNDKGDYSGSAYVFDVATGNQLVKVMALDGASGDVFGHSLALSYDGERLAVGAYYSDNEMGSAYVFDVGTGIQLFHLHPLSGASEFFGYSVSITSDGTHLAVGGDTYLLGSAYLFPLLLPTPAPTAPTPAPSSGASASGDPHVTNVDGARFDIMKAGVHEFLRLPRRVNQSHGSAEPDPLLSVLAAVERPNEDECHESYVKQVDVTGARLNSSGPLRFRAIGESSDNVRAIMVSINGSLVDVPALSRDSRVHSFLEVVEPSTPRAKHVSGAVQKVPMLTVKLSFSGAILKIDWMHRAVPSGQSLNHLNFQANGLRRLLDSAGMDIGGILGRDDHSEAASLPSDCKPAGADLRVASRASGQEGDLQVITAAL